MISLYHLLKFSKKKNNVKFYFFSRYIPHFCRSQGRDDERWALRDDKREKEYKKPAKAKIALAGGAVAHEKFIIDREQLKSGVNRRAR